VIPCSLLPEPLPFLVGELLRLENDEDLLQRAGEPEGHLVDVVLDDRWQHARRKRRRNARDSEHARRRRSGRPSWWRAGHAQVGSSH
jgi:hypothetical protein